MLIQPEQPAAKAPAERFAGDVSVEPIAWPRIPEQKAVLARIRFAPGARTAWHSHPLGQTLHVTEGIALMQARGGDILTVRPGQTVYTPPGEEHWYGAAPDNFMVHLALVQLTEDGQRAIWLDHVSTDEYLACISRVRQPTRGTR